ncbi:MAG: hypothetical protein HZB39_20615 [Planctomycetes bacterium]|nr:hypothetical protein [Planctomycetota bacterium]
MDRSQSPRHRIVILAPVILAASFALLESTPPQQATDAAANDVVRLKVGTELAGRITAQTDDFVMIEIGPGNVVGFALDQVEAIVRGASAVRATPELPPALHWFRERDEWFVLHDAAGRGVGTLHETAARDADGSVRLGEEWRFHHKDGVTDITRLEVVGTDGAPVSAFARERSIDRNERLTDERVVQGSIAAGQIAVTVRSLRGEERKSHDFGPRTRLPLELRAALRARPGGEPAVENHAVFDVQGARFASEAWSSGAFRRIPGPSGDAIRARWLATPSGSEWLDAAGATLRREVNGPALVAVPCSAADASRRSQSDRFPKALVAEPGGTFAMWLPSTVWSFQPNETPGQISALDAIDEAGVSLVRFDHLDSALALPSATDAVLRWLALVQPGFRVLDRSTVTLRGAHATRVRAAFDGRDQITGGPQQYETLVHVVRAGDTWFAACGTAPRTHFAQVEPDLVWIAERFELAAEGFSAEPAGPARKSGSPRPGR